MSIYELTYLFHHTLHRLELFPRHTAEMNFKVRVFIFLLCATFIHVLLRVSWRFPTYTSPCACEKCLSEDDPWFLQFFNKSVEPFLSPKDNLSEDAFNWWKVSCLSARYNHIKLSSFLLLFVFDNLILR